MVTSLCAPQLGTRGRLGFTILEIMIATAILTIGLVSVIALSPAAIHTGKQIVDTSVAAVVGDSVANAIREGIRNRLRHVTRGGGSINSYFAFEHDGVMDAIPTRSQDERSDKEYYILLPRFSSRSKIFANKEAAVRNAKTFLYPETDDNPNGGGDCELADDDGDDLTVELPNREVYKDVRVEKTYKLGEFLPAMDATAGENVLEDQRIESLKQYSFAFTIKASENDVNLSQTPGIFEPGNRLYWIRIMIFRGFLPPGPEDKPQDPVFELYFEVST